MRYSPFFTILLLCAVFLNGLQSQTCSNNTVVNQSYTLGTTAWQGNMQLTTDANSAPNAVMSCTPYLPSYQTIAGQPNTNYNFEVFTKKDAGTQGLVYVKFLTSTWSVINTEFYPISGSTYNKISQSITSPANTAWVEVGILKESGTGCVFADDWCFGTGGGGGACAITSSLVDVECSDNGTPNDPLDDRYSFTVLVEKTGNCGGTWFDYTTGQTGSYGVPTTFASVPVTLNSVNVVIADTQNPVTAAPLLVQSPGPCSNGGTGGTCTNNLLQNADFNNSTVWLWSSQGQSSGISYITGTDAFNGQSVSICKVGERIYQTVNVQGGKTYTLQAQTKRTQNAKGLLVIKYLDANWTPLAQDFFPTENANYALTTGTLTAPAGAVRAEVSFYHNSGTGCVFADDFCFSENGGADPCSPDITPPNLTDCPLSMTLNTTGTSAVANWTPPTATDACPGAVTLNATHQPGTSFPVGMTTVTYTAVDASGNTRYCSFMVTVDFTQTNLPDLTISNLFLNQNTIEQGKVLTYNFNLANIGLADAPGNFNVKAYISTDSDLSADDIQDGIVPTGNFIAGFSVPVTGASTIPANLPLGTYYILLKVDADNQVTESDENNNIVFSAGQFTVNQGGTSATNCDKPLGFGTHFNCFEKITGTTNYRAVVDSSSYPNTYRSEYILSANLDIISKTGPTQTNTLASLKLDTTSLTKTNADGSVAYVKTIPQLLFDKIGYFGASVVEFQGGYVFTTFRNAPTKPIYSVDELYAIRTDINFNIQYEKLIGTGSGIPGYNYFTGLKIISPDRLSGILVTGLGASNRYDLVVFDETMEKKSSRNFINGVFSIGVGFVGNICRGFTVTDNIGTGYCKSGGCYQSHAYDGEFVNDEFIAYNSMGFVHQTSLGQGSETWNWLIKTTDGGRLEASRVQTLPAALNTVIHFKKYNAAGTLVSEFDHSVPNTDDVLRLYEDGGQIFVVKKLQSGLFTIANINCYGNTGPGNGCGFFTTLPSTLNANTFLNAVETNSGFDYTFSAGNQKKTVSLNQAGNITNQSTQTTTPVQLYSLTQTVAGNTVNIQGKSPTGATLWNTTYAPSVPGTILQIYPRGFHELDSRFFVFGSIVMQMSGGIEFYHYLLNVDKNSGAILNINRMLETDNAPLIISGVYTIPDGSYLVLNQISGQINGEKVSSTGASQWKQTIMGDLPSSDLIQIAFTPDAQNVYVSVNDNLRYEIDKRRLSDGQLLWTSTNTLQYFYQSGGRFIQMPNGDLVAAFYGRRIPSGPYHTIIRRITSSGTSLWEILSFPDTHQDVQPVASASDGGILFVGQTNGNYFALKTTGQGSQTPPCTGGGGTTPDLELTVSATPLMPGQWKNTSITLTLQNKGTVAATGVKVKTPASSNTAFRDKMAYVSHSASSGSYNDWTGEWIVGTVAAGQTVTLTYNGFTKIAGPIDYFAQVSAQSPNDADSAPNNNTSGTPAEDDEALVSINGTIAFQAGDLGNFASKERTPEAKLFPNPAKDYFQVDLSNFAGQAVDLRLYNAYGQVVLEKLNLTSELEYVDLNGVQSGAYQVQLRTAGQRPVVVRVIVERGM